MAERTVVPMTPHELRDLGDFLTELQLFAEMALERSEPDPGRANMGAVWIDPAMVGRYADRVMAACTATKPSSSHDPAR